MSEYIVQVPDEQAEQFIAKFGIEGTQIFGFWLTGEIVRCRDCEYYHPELCDIGRASCQLWIKPSEPDGYCAWGVRKDGSDER